MDLATRFMHLVFPPIAIFLLTFIFPPFAFCNLLLSLFRTLKTEDVRGKVVLITGASSGIGKHMAYKYAKRGACMVLVARREQRLREVAERARSNGSAEVLVLPADVSRLDACKRFIEETINHFGHLDHLVNNAGVAFVDVFEEVTSITNLQEVMNVNFWGAIYPTYYAIPHLRKVRGKIVVDASATAGFPVPRISAYHTSKAAVVNFYEPMSMEIGDEIGITSEAPGWTESEISKGIFMNCKGMQVDQKTIDALISAMPVMPADECAEGIVKSASQGERNITEPFWVRILILYRLLVPETVKWSFALLSPTKQWRGRQLPSKSLDDDAKSK